MEKRSWHSTSPAATRTIGAEIWRLRGLTTVIALSGDLGAGKTELVKGLAQAAGYGGAVTSPTFTLCQEYPISEGILYHVDLYRLSGPEDFEGIGLWELLPPDGGVVLIEWAEKAAGCLPVDAIEVVLRNGTEPDERWVEALFPGDGGGSDG
ncbi:MAG: tRNA (adenosine(37)-N6)-threonylcarbamoyltransferase complex ATPase subunit type 1 TsaE [Verrucomicrobiota bacterium]|nr:tRNA (adenosine(37)-N6)-threonylcarbamoyltransferase complex ATPase subunit type 1 TsaE [Verrucomicrobiota bacterium]